VGQDRRHWNYFAQCNNVTRLCCTFVVVLNACDNIVAFEEGNSAHEQTI